MKITPRLVVALLWLLLQAGRAAPPSWSGDAALGAKELEGMWSVVNDPGRAVGIRGVFRFAVEATGIGWHPERVEAALARARALQDLDPASPTRGNFKWSSGHAGVQDLNAVEFSAQLMGFLARVQSDRLSAKARGQLDELMTDAITGLRSHVVKIDYTNIFVMKAWGLIALGEALGRPEVAADGYARFDAWMDYTAKNGIGEYGAVVYYGIDLDSLALIARHAGRAEARAKAERAIRLVWTDLAANWWAPGDRMGGTNARTYDYLYGRGYTEAHTWTAGWLRARPELEGAGWLGGAQPNLNTFRAAVMWRPAEEWTEAIRAEVPRVVVQQWGERPEQRAVNWIGRRVSLASSGAARSRDERTLVANLGDAPAVPQLTLFMEGRDDPYGLKKQVGGKALHFMPFIATVQRGAEVLQVLSDDPLKTDPRNKAGELKNFTTHFTVPATAEVWIGDARVEPGEAVPAGAAVFVRLGDAVIGLRILLATTTAGGVAPAEFLADTRAGVARRITVRHSATEPRGRGTLAVWLRAADGLDAAAFAAWRREFGAAPAEATLAGDTLVAEAAGWAGALRIEADVARGARRVLAGGEPAASLSVNGREVGRAGDEALNAPGRRR
jgi:hypothetical protein